MQPDISVVVPMKNEAPNVAELYTEITAALDAYGRPYEVIAIDDGSTDETFNLLARLQEHDARLTVIRFRRNYGQTAGFAAGFAHARGRYIVTLDGDLQNDPRDIAAMVKQLEDESADIVAGWRKNRKDKFISRRLPSMMANRLISRATGVRLHDYGCSLKVFRAEVVKPMKLYGEMHRFLPAIATEFGAKTIEREVHHRARLRGSSKYGISRTLRVILDLITVKFLISYRTRPVQIFGLWGLGMGSVGAAMLAWLVFVKYVQHEGIGDRPLLIIAIFLMSTGMQLVSLGLLGEMMARTYHESQDKPTYVIREIRQVEAPRKFEALR